MSTPPPRPHPAGSELPTSATPRAIAWVDGRIVPAHDATVPLMDDGFLRGDAVFEAVMVRAGRTHALDAHLARLRSSAQALDLRVPVLRQVIADLLAAWGENEGTLKLIVTRGGIVRGTMTSGSWPATMALEVIDTPWRSALSGVKTLSYALNQWAIRAAQSRGADDALIVDDGRVLELPTGSICLVHDGVISSPDPARLPILASVTVEALRAAVEVVPTMPTVADAWDADELFVVSATRPVLPVHLLRSEGAERTLAAPGPVTQDAAERFEAHIAASLDPLP
jgi:branched-chain amino acid aminotransferase